MSAMIRPHSAAEWSLHLAQLLPRGRAWQAEPGTRLRALLSGLAAGFARAEASLAQLIEEADPRTTDALLADWERTVGLPDECSSGVGSTAQRQAAIALRLAATGGQSRAYFEQLGAGLGFTIEVEEFRPCRVGDRVGVRVYTNSWRFVWRVRATSMGANAADFECLFRRLAPAHTHVLFVYPE